MSGAFEVGAIRWAGSAAAAGGLFNGERAPRIVVLAAFSPVVGNCLLGTGVIGTSTIAGQAMVDISADVRQIAWQRGRDSDIDTAQVGTCTITVNNDANTLAGAGAYDPTNLSGPFVAGGVSLITLGTAVEVYAEWPTGVFTPLFTGTLADVGIDTGWDPVVTFTVSDGLETLGRTQLATEPAQFTGNTTGQRVSNLADRAGWSPLKRKLDTGQVTLGPTTLGGTALELMQQVERTEFGLLFVDAAGYLVFFERHRATNAARSTVAQARLTDTSGPAELGMMDLHLSLSRDRVYNDVHVTRQAGADEPDVEPVEQVAQSAASISAYGTLNFPAEAGTLLRSDPEALNLAEGLVSVYASQRVRIREVQINALRGSPGGGDVWPALLGLELLDRISVRRQYGDAPHVITSDLLIQSISVEVTANPPMWQYTLTTSEPPPTPDFCVIGTDPIGSDVTGW